MTPIPSAPSSTPLRAQLDAVNDQGVAVASIHAHSKDHLGVHQRLIEKITAKLGRPPTIYLLLAIVLAWMLLNAFLLAAGRSPWDAPPFLWLQGAVGLYAAVISTMVLTTQTRQQRHSEQRAYLELQVNLTSEQKTAKLIALLEELRRDLPGVRSRVDPQADAMAQAVDPIAVMTALEETLESTIPPPGAAIEP
jgi:uncharacterized membrane protein